MKTGQILSIEAQLSEFERHCAARVPSHHWNAHEKQKSAKEPGRTV